MTMGVFSKYHLYYLPESIQDFLSGEGGSSDVHQGRSRFRIHERIKVSLSSERVFREISPLQSTTKIHYPLIRVLHVRTNSIELYLTSHRQVTILFPLEINNSRIRPGRRYKGWKCW